MRSKKIWWWLLLLFSGIGLVLALAVFFDQVKGKAVIQGVRQIRRGQAESVSLSHRVTRLLTRNDSRAESMFRDLMTQRGWEFICYYGRSALYRDRHQEVLARKTPLVGGFCIYELLDEAWLKHMKTDIREVA